MTDTAVNVLSSVNAGEYLDIKPGSAGVEWCIHNIVCETTCELYLSNGTNEVKFDTNTANAGWINQAWFITYTNYLRVKNTSASPAYFGYTGIISNAT